MSVCDKKTFSFLVVIVLACISSTLSAAQMAPAWQVFDAGSMSGLPSPLPAGAALSDEEMSDVGGQGLVVIEQINGTGNAAGFTFTRMGLDANLYLNANIDRMQLGCGGFNEVIRSGSCDIDMEYVRLMGRYTGTGNNPTQTSAGGNGRAGDPVTSDFLLTRPYVEIATKGTGVQREVAGIKIGSQEANGFFGVGSVVGGTHKGLSSFSGYMNVFLSGYVRFGTGLGDGNACIGVPDGYGACSGSPDGVMYNNPNMNDQYKTAFMGTRLSQIYMSGVPLRNLHGAGGLLNILSGSDMYAQMSARLNEVHGFELNGTKDFFMSFQREKIYYPNYDKTTYAQPANAGWWMNVPRVELKNLEPAKVELGCPSACFGLLDSFSRPGINAGFPDLRSIPPNNCYGTSRFC